MTDTTGSSTPWGHLRLPRLLRQPALPKPDDPLGLFGDGPPTWTINKDKLCERESPSAREAMKQRDAAAFKLRWHAKHVASLSGNETPTSLAVSALADKLEACAPPNCPCLSGACPVCMRAQQRWFVKDTMRVLRPLVVHSRYRARVLSLVPEFGRILPGSLSKFDIDLFFGSMQEALKTSGIDYYKLGLDISLNQRAGVAGPGFWQRQLWGFFHKPKRGWRVKLTARLNPNGRVTRPVKVVKPDSLEAAAAYGVKSIFVRRLSYRKANLHRGECWNTRGRHLRGDACVELMLFLDRVGLQNRILSLTTILSVPRLHSRNGPRLRGSK